MRVINEITKLEDVEPAGTSVGQGARPARRWGLLAALLAVLAPLPSGAPASAEPRTLKGSWELRGQTLGLPDEELVNEGSLVGYGVLRAARLTNRGSIQLSGGSSQVAGPVENLGSFEVARGSARFEAAVTNRGTFKTSDAEVHFAAPYTELGVYWSDPSDNYFTDLVIGETGYLVGGAGDRFFVTGDFISSSTANTSWNTVDAYLEFRTGVDGQHAFHITGANRGAMALGYTDNFAWGTLHIASGNSLVLFDGNATPGGGLYVKEITGVTASGSAVTNISGAESVNIYYMPDLAANAYLGGFSYDLGGSGRLVPIVSVPVPASSGWSVAALALLLLTLGAAAIRLRRAGPDAGLA